MTQLRETRVAVAIVLGAAVVRFWRLDAQSLWIDEWFAVTDAQLSLQRILTLRDGEPALHKALLHGLFGVTGVSDWWARAPSALAGTVAVWVVFDLGRRWFDGVVGLMAAAFLAINPFAIWYSQEARGYSLALLAALGSARAVEVAWREGTGRAWTRYAAWVWLGVGSHYYFTFLVAAQAGLVGWWHAASRRRWSTLLPAGGAVLLAVLCWIPGLLGDLGAQAAEDATQRMSWWSVPYMGLTFVGGMSWGPPLRVLQSGLATQRPPAAIVAEFGPSVGFALLVATGLTWGAVGRLRSGRMGVATIVLAMASIGGALLAGALVTGFRPRYVLTAVPFVLLGWAVGLRGGPRWYCWCGGLALIGIGAAAFSRQGDASYARPDLRAAAGAIERFGDVEAVVLIGEGTSPFPHYAQPGWPVLVVLRPVVADPLALQRFVDEAIANRRVVVTVSARAWTIDPAGATERLLAQQFKGRATLSLAGVDVHRWERSTVAGGG